MTDEDPFQEDIPSQTTGGFAARLKKEREQGQRGSSNPKGKTQTTENPFWVTSFHKFDIGLLITSHDKREKLEILTPLAQKLVGLADHPQPIHSVGIPKITMEAPPKLSPYEIETTYAEQAIWTDISIVAYIESVNQDNAPCFAYFATRAHIGVDLLKCADTGELIDLNYYTHMMHSGLLPCPDHIHTMMRRKLYFAGEAADKTILSFLPPKDKK